MTATYPRNKAGTGTFVRNIKPVYFRVSPFRGGHRYSIPPTASFPSGLPVRAARSGYSVPAHKRTQKQVLYLLCPQFKDRKSPSCCIFSTFEFHLLSSGATHRVLRRSPSLMPLTSVSCRQEAALGLTMEWSNTEARHRAPKFGLFNTDDVREVN